MYTFEIKQISCLFWERFGNITAVIKTFGDILSSDCELHIFIVNLEFIDLIKSINNIVMLNKAFL